MTDIRRDETIVTAHPPPADDPVRRHIENVAYDHGRRTALRQQLKAIVDQAAAQARRATKTADGPLADGYEQELAEGDSLLWRILNLALRQ